MERYKIFTGPLGTRGTLFQTQGQLLSGPEGAAKPRTIGRAASLLLECLDGCLNAAEAAKPLGVYVACDGGYYEAAPMRPELRDYGPKEFSHNFHSLWIYPAVNHLGLTGPVSTFSDPDFGFSHACAGALRDLERGTTRAAAVMHLYLQGPGPSIEESDYLAGFVTSSSFWLKNVLRHVRQVGPRQGFPDLFTGMVGENL